MAEEEDLGFSSEEALIDLSSADLGVVSDFGYFETRIDRIEAIERESIVVTLSSFDTVAVADRRALDSSPPVVEIEATAFAPTWSTTLPISFLEVEITVGVPTWRITYGDSGQLQPVGFEVRVLAAPSYTTVLAVIADWESLTFSVEINAEGAGSIVMDLDSPFWLATLPGGYSPYKLIDEEHLWEIWDNGQLRFQFFGQVVRETMLEETLSQEVSISGPGTAEVLKWPKVFPPGFPTSTAETWVFNPTPSSASISLMQAWRQLLAAAQARGTLPMVTTSFTDLQDSEGENWADVGSAGTYEPDIGSDLLEVLNEITGQDSYTKATLVVDWIMRPNFVLEAARIIGTHREDKVIFYDNRSTRTRSRVRDRHEISNYQATIAEGGVNSVVTSSSSVARYNQRETLMVEPEQTDTTTRLTLTQSRLEQSKNEKSEWTVKVQYGIPGAMPWVNFWEGDWIGMERYTPVAVDPLTGDMSGGVSVVEVFRCLAITIRVNQDGEVEMELTLDNKLASQRKELAKRVGKLVTAQKTAALKGFS